MSLTFISRPVRGVLFVTLLFSVALLLFVTKTAEQVDEQIYDSFLPSLMTRADSNIVIVAIDEYSLAQLGRWPWSRALHAEFIERMSRAGVRAIGFNLIFADPSDNAESDRLLVAAIDANGQVVLPATYEPVAAGEGLRLTRSLPGLNEAAAGFGHTDISAEQGVVRGVYLAAGINRPSLPAFALALQHVAEPFAQVQLFGERSPLLDASLSGRWLRDYRVLIPFAGPPGSFARVSFADILQPQFDLTLLQDKIVLVGVTAVGLADSFVSPVGAQGSLMPGVEVQANLLQALRDKRVITPLSAIFQLAFVLSLLVAAALAYPRLSASQSIIFAALLAAFPLLLSFVLLNFAMLWLAPSVAIICAVLSYLLLAAFRLHKLVRELFSVRERSRVTLNSIGDAVIVVNLSGQVDYLNAAAIHMVDKTLVEAKQLKLAELFELSQEKHRIVFDDAFKQCLAVAGVVRLSEGIALENDQQSLIVTATFAPVFDIDGEVSGVVISLADVTDNIKTSQQLAFQATHDALTELPNRVLLIDRLGLAIKRAQRSNEIIAVLFLDLDRFKNINDALGHASGDELLKAVAERLQHSARRGDTVARLGGDEFVVLLEGVRESSAIASVAYKILSLAELPYQIEGRELFVASSIGISAFPKDGLSASVLLKHADTAMYQAKAQGRNSVQFYSHEMNSRTLERLEIEKELRYALQNDEFELYFQPQINQKSGQLIGVEALLRWQKNGEIVRAPDEFIPVAEDSGFIQAMGEWVLESACQQFADWREQGLPTVPIAINVSPRQLYNSEFVQALERALDDASVPAEYLDIEITERTIMTDVPRAAELLQDIRNIGCRVSIDDFGTGYSSLSYLKQLPVSALKIDQSFVQGVDEGDENRAITQAIITMAHGMGMVVIAEGVELKGQLEVLVQQGCDNFQGYYFSRPLSSQQLSLRLRAAGAEKVWRWLGEKEIAGQGEPE